jgi:hypothetical protein
VCVCVCVCVRACVRVSVSLIPTHWTLWWSLQGLTKTGYLNDPALKATTFDPAFIKVVFDCALFLCVQGSAVAVLLVRAVLGIKPAGSMHVCSPSRGK